MYPVKYLKNVSYAGSRLGKKIEDKVEFIVSKIAYRKFYIDRQI